jgi:hypothetical protein
MVKHLLRDLRRFSRISGSLQGKGMSRHHIPAARPALHGVGG